MYQRILLAYEGSLEGRAALREGALLAKRCDAKVFLLSVVTASTGVSVAESTLPGPAERHEQYYRGVLDEGAARLRELGFSPVAELVTGDPAQQIAAFARRMRADLVVVGYRRKNRLERWWSGPSGAYLSELLDCSLLLSRNAISDEHFQAELQKATPSGGN
jgi:nucleotide-binding universal stress UspA family protein